MKQFNPLQADLGIFVHASVIFRRVMGLIEPESELKDLLKIFSACLFISFKFVVCEDLCYLEDFSSYVRMNQDVLSEFEQEITINILEFKLNVDQPTFERELKYLQAVNAQS